MSACVSVGQAIIGVLGGFAAGLAVAAIVALIVGGDPDQGKGPT